jgi:hypothetical protein
MDASSNLRDKLVAHTGRMQEDTCTATLRDGRPCRYRPKEGGVCGIHARSAARENARQRQECCICLESIEPSKARRLGCGHVFHRACVGKWLRRSMTCPMCRTACMSNVKLSDRMVYMLSVCPPPQDMVFSSFMHIMLHRQVVSSDLGLSPSDVDYLLAVADHSLAPEHFISYLRQLEV